MTTTVTSAIRISGATSPAPDYTTLTAWESGEQDNITAAGSDEIHIAECYNDWSSGLDDYFNVGGWTTDATHYIEIKPADGEGHTGVLSDGGNYTGFTIKSTGATAGVITTANSYVKLRGLAIDYGSAGTYALFSNVGNTEISECLITNWATTGIYCVSGAKPTKVKNCIIIDCDTGVHVYDDSKYIYNCTIIGSARGIYFQSVEGPVNIYNCLIDGGTTYCIGGDSNGPTVAYCATSDATADDWLGAGSRINQTFTYEDSDNDDYHLASDDAGAKGYGTDLSSDSDYPFDDDIDGETRSAWDIGADEYSAGAPSGNPWNYYAQQ